MKTKQISAANHRLNTVDLSADAKRMTFHVFSLRYIYGKHERKNTLYTPGAHRHTYFEVHLPVSGEQEYRLNEQCITLSKGKCLLIAPGAVHSIPVTSVDLRKYAIAFDFPMADEKTSDTWICDALSSIAEYRVIEDPSHINRIYELFQEIILEAYEARSGWLDYIKNLVACMLAEFARCVIMDEACACIPFEGEALRRVEQVERFVRDNIALSLTCPDIAHFMNFSVKQIDRNVRAVRSMSLHDLILSIKFNEAKRLMRNPEMSLLQIATRIGFSDVTGFYRFFKKQSGLSPNRYRTIRAQEGG